MLNYQVYILEISIKYKPLIYKIGYSADLTKRIKSFKSVEKPSSAVKGMNIIINYITVLATACFTDKEAAILYEKQLQYKYKEYKYNGSPLLPSANSELFTYNIAKLELHYSNTLLVKY